MKPRKVLLNIEVTTDAPLRALQQARRMYLYKRYSSCISYAYINHIQVNVIRPKKTLPMRGACPSPSSTTVGYAMSGGGFRVWRVKQMRKKEEKRA